MRDWSGSDTTSSSETEVGNEGGRRRIQAQRQSRRRRRYLDNVKGSWNEVSPCWSQKCSQKQYLREWNELLRSVNLTVDQARAHGGNDLDSIIVKHFEILFFDGEQPIWVE